MNAKWRSPTKEDQIQFDPSDIFDAGEKNHHIANTAYPIAHDLTWKPYRISNEQVRDSIVRSFVGLDSLNLYSHIPFCETRCYFCEYTVVNKKESESTKEYMDALNEEVRLYGQLLGNRKIVGFDIGGGTPSFVPAEQITKHVHTVNKYFSLTSECEISIETTPKIASSDFQKLNSYVQSGIRRISMGIQVAEPNLLKLLGRSETSISHHFKAMENMRNAGFKKINIDLMYGFANQSLESWDHTLRHTLSLKPDYITLYRMRYKLTRISDQAKDVQLSIVREQSRLAKKILLENGYFTNPGKNTFSKIQGDPGTSSYLTRRVIQGKSYLGLGLGSQSFTDTSISYNSGSIGKNLAPYLQKIVTQTLPIQDFYDLPRIQMMAKMIAVSFYFGEINLHAFRKKFGVELETVYPDAISFLLKEEMMVYTKSENGKSIQSNGVFDPEDSFSLTEKGATYFNGCIALFYAPSVQNYLLQKNESEIYDFERNKKLATIVSNNK